MHTLSQAHQLTVSLSLPLVSFLSHINQIYSQNDHLFKADYLKESHLSNYNTTTLSTEPDIIPGVCICVALHTIYTIFLSACQHPRVHTRTSAFLPNLLHCNLFSRVHLHNCMVSLDTSFTTFFFPINKYIYPLSNLHGTKTASASLQKASYERSLFKCSFVFYLFITVSAPHPGDQIKYSKGPKGSLILYKATSTLLFQKQIAFIVDLQQCPAWRHEDMRTT